MSNNKNQLESQTISKLFYKFAIPASIGMLVNSLYVVADGVFISRGIGSVGIAAVNIGYPIINLTAALSLMFGAGGATLISLNSENQNFKNKSFTYTIILNLFFYILIASLVFMFPNQIMKSLGATELLLPMVKDYMYPCIIASFFLMLSISLNAVVRNDNAPKKAMNSLFIGAITNIVLDYVFIFRFKMGIEGGAYATAIGQILSAIYLCMHFPNSSFKFDFNLKDIQWNLMGKICSLGFSSFILEFAVMVITILLNITLSRTEGQIGVAAYGIISYSFVIYRMLFTGLAQGIQPIVSFNYGRRNFKKVLEIFKFAHKFCFIASTIALLLAKLLALDVVKIFTTEAHLFEYTAKGLFLYSSAIIFVGANFMNISYLQAMDKALLANFISVCRGVVFMGIGILVLPKFLGVNGIWLTLPFADVMTFFLTCIIFKIFEINKNLKKSSI
ncbi:MATE family efflux transporter [uncultured Cetobacterium sp.]|uniref:MATE family efflux transporter n=1 Tax=uncultured Cetobacterium sp. TaxID=527638 RepID=UPI00262591D6|nr:MATE family efflux transporter [uncultured Cetobacterium sp.]